jgi:hypothetical protein
MRVGNKERIIDAPTKSGAPAETGGAADRDKTLVPGPAKINSSGTVTRIRHSKSHTSRPRDTAKSDMPISKDVTLPVPRHSDFDKLHSALVRTIFFISESM